MKTSTNTNSPIYSQDARRKSADGTHPTRLARREPRSYTQASAALPPQPHARQSQPAVEDIPSVDTEASSYAAEFFAKNFGLRVDPDKTYFNEFAVTPKSQFSESGRLNLSGLGQWSDTHPKGSLQKSTSLTDLVKHNFDDSFIDSAQATGGDSRFGVYGSRDKDREYTPADNKVPIQALREKWKGMDFAGHYATKLSSFMETNGTSIAKAASLGAVQQADALRSSGKLSQEDHQIALAGFVDPSLNAQSKAERRVSVHTVEIQGRQSTNMLRIQDEATGRNVLFAPGEDAAVKGFGSHQALDKFLGGRTEEDAQAFALRHFSNNDATGRDGSAGTSAGDALGPRRTPGGRWLPPMQSGPGRDITQAPFKTLMDATRKGFEDDARYEITTNKDVHNRQIQRLADLPLMPPGASGIAQMALGKTPGERAAGLGSLAFDAIASLVPEAAAGAKGLKGLASSIRNAAQNIDRKLGGHVLDHVLKLKKPEFINGKWGYPMSPMEAPGGVNIGSLPSTSGNPAKVQANRNPERYLIKSGNPKEIESAVKILEKDATEFYKNPFIPARPKMPLLHESPTPEAMLAGISKKADGFVLGETHGSQACLQFAIDNIKNLKKHGYNKIFLEVPQEEFAQIDPKIPASKYLTGHLKEYSDELELDVKNPLRLLMGLASYHGIKLIPIDTIAASAWNKSFTNRSVEFLNPEKRLKSMNYYAMSVINKEQAENPGKWLAIVGDAHRATASFTNSRKKVVVPGIAELAGGFSAYASDAAQGQPTVIDLLGNVHNFSRGTNSMMTHPDFLIRNRYVSYPESKGPNTKGIYR